MSTTVDLINLSPLASLDGDVLERVWIRKDVFHKHLRVFGCRACIHIPKDERSKFDDIHIPKDDEAKERIFLGCGHEEFGYKLYDPMSRKFIR